jgi:2-phosphosulfolactate phosphatase
MNQPEIRCEWGAPGIERLRDQTDVYIIVDVLSFTTCVDIAVSRGAWIYPYVWNDLTSAEFVKQIGGTMAVTSRSPGFSLSPLSLLEIPAGTKLVLPSPNGSTLSLRTGQVPTLAGCLRNARSVAQATQKMGQRISVIPGGELWKDGGLRVAVEDWLGAGAIIANLNGETSAEAELASRAFKSSIEGLRDLLLRSISGQELIERGRVRDVHLAAELNISTAAPRLIERAYVQSA